MAIHLDREAERALVQFGSLLDHHRRRQQLSTPEWRERARVSKKGFRWLALRHDPRFSTLCRAAAGLGLVVRIGVRQKDTENTNGPLVTGRLAKGNDV